MCSSRLAWPTASQTWVRGALRWSWSWFNITVKRCCDGMLSVVSCRCFVNVNVQMLWAPSSALSATNPCATVEMSCPCFQVRSLFLIKFAVHSPSRPLPSPQFDLTPPSRVCPLPDIEKYITTPSCEDLMGMDATQLTRVTDFKVERPGFGSIRWFGDTNIRSLNLNELVEIGDNEVRMCEARPKMQCHVLHRSRICVRSRG
jgi:hypothetical protein